MVDTYFDQTGARKAEIVGFDDIFHVVGCGNAVKRGEKMNVYKMNTNPCYTAPEIRHDLSGKVVRTKEKFGIKLYAAMLADNFIEEEALESPERNQQYAPAPAAAASCQVLGGADEHSGDDQH